MKVVLYLLKVILAVFLVVFITISINFYTNDSIIKFISFSQDSKVYQSLFEIYNPCKNNRKIKELNGTLFLDEIKISDDIGSCYKKHIKDNKILEINVNYGGRKTSALIIGDEIRENNLNVLIKEECYSACVDILIHGKERFVCNGAIIGIHQQSARMENKWLAIYLRKNDEYSINKYKKFGLKTDKIISMVKKNPT